MRTKFYFYLYFFPSKKGLTFHVNHLSRSSAGQIDDSYEIQSYFSQKNTHKKNGM